MTDKAIRRIIMLGTAAAAGLYGYIAGKGPFNKRRFAEQHDVVSKYVETNFPGCTYSGVSPHGRGWAVTVRRRGYPVGMVYFSKSPDGIYVFTKTDAKK